MPGILAVISESDSASQAKCSGSGQPQLSPHQLGPAAAACSTVVSQPGFNECLQHEETLQGLERGEHCSMVRMMTCTMVRLHSMIQLTQLLTLTLLSSLCSGETQVFRSQPGDVTVQAGDKVRGVQGHSQKPSESS